ncbi:TPA: type4 fimbrial accessory protein [Pseudomonas aeruginosa]|nr:type4 fimbrial accessory protein [Pseudomonas aeruginosa]
MAMVRIAARERFKVAGIHLFFAAILSLLALSLVLFLWYPSPFFHVSGVQKVLGLIFFCNLVFGPVLTFLVYKKNKLKFLFDISIILLVQVSSFAYGLHVLSVGRPAWLVFVVDDFEVVRPVDLDVRNGYVDLGVLNGPRWIAATYSDDPVIRKAQREDEIFLGISLARRPEAYTPLESRKDEIKYRLKPISELLKYNSEKKVEAAIGGWLDLFGWLPLKGTAADLVVLFDQNIKIIAVVDLRPW